MAQKRRRKIFFHPLTAKSVKERGENYIYTCPNYPLIKLINCTMRFHLYAGNGQSHGNSCERFPFLNEYGVTPPFAYNVACNLLGIDSYKF
jgi:hypothetical protein